jgi:hypothetical protein
MDRDGYISNGELYLVLKMMVGNNLKVCRNVVYGPTDHNTKIRTPNYNK